MRLIARAEKEGDRRMVAYMLHAFPASSRRNSGRMRRREINVAS